jgi:hypothetical protein
MVGDPYGPKADPWSWQSGGNQPPDSGGGGPTGGATPDLWKIFQNTVRDRNVDIDAQAKATIQHYIQNGESTAATDVDRAEQTTQVLAHMACDAAQAAKSPTATKPSLTMPVWWSLIGRLCPGFWPFC